MRPWRMPPRHRRDAKPTRRPYVRIKGKSPEVLGGTGLHETPDTAGDDNQIIARRDRPLLLTVAAAGAASREIGEDHGTVWHGQ